MFATQHYNAQHKTRGAAVAQIEWGAVAQVQCSAVAQVKVQAKCPNHGSDVSGMKRYLVRAFTDARRILAVKVTVRCPCARTLLISSTQELLGACAQAATKLTPLTLPVLPPSRISRSRLPRTMGGARRALCAGVWRPRPALIKRQAPSPARGQVPIWRGGQARSLGGSMA